MAASHGGIDLKVGHAGLDLASQDLGTASQNLDSLRSDLNAELDRLKPQWTGAAQDAYGPARAKWDQAVDEMILLLRDVGTTTSQVNQGFQDTDRRNAGLFGG